MLCAARVLSVLAFTTSPISSESHATHESPTASATLSAGGSTCVTLAPSSRLPSAAAAAAAPCLIARDGHVGGPGPSTPTASAATPLVYTPSVAPTRSLQSSISKSSGSSMLEVALVVLGATVCDLRVNLAASFSPAPAPAPATPLSPTRRSATHTSLTMRSSEGIVSPAGARNARANRGQGHGGIRRNDPNTCVRSHSARVSAMSAGVAL
mmetsp:Transcript_9514/g.35391  ORF Transcript_9514/g.35391 Transcript_9514/m.35391 type:complete len:211 (+) Transcript_9514:1784-2416(+)